MEKSKTQSISVKKSAKNKTKRPTKPSKMKKACCKEKSSM